jgi:hypothetical protein
MEHVTCADCGSIHIRLETETWHENHTVNLFRCYECDNRTQVVTRNNRSIPSTHPMACAPDAIREMNDRVFKKLLNRYSTNPLDACIYE